MIQYSKQALYYRKSWHKMCDDLLAAKGLVMEIQTHIHGYEKKGIVITPEFKQNLELVLVSLGQRYELCINCVSAKYTITFEQLQELESIGYMRARVDLLFFLIEYEYKKKTSQTQFCGVTGKEGKQLYTLCNKLHRCLPKFDEFCDQGSWMYKRPQSFHELASKEKPE